MPERLSFKELRDLYDKNVAGREVLGQQVTFEEWLEMREKCRTDKSYLKEVLNASKPEN